MKNFFACILVFILIFTCSGCSSKNSIERIKKGTLNACHDYTIEELINNYMQDPKWETLKSDKGYYVYNVTGKAYYKDNLSNMLIQFALDEDDIVVKAFEVNKIEQDALVYSVLVDDMCKEMESLKLSDIISESKLKEAGKKFYEEFYYDSFVKSAEERKNMLAEFETIGIKINLDNLSRSGYFNVSDEIKNSCMENTILIIYPKNPYGKKDYTIEVWMDCKN